ncbi:polysaccharide biosynthesis/export family protein [Aliiroseovarius sp. KMU-50]|uniref:Polysaccharide biosynthesis/export family protein n=2 Tax=Aliiroseovarius salicola TaxID=3009082 RepID=A0ABT4W2A1_9RHOB|nr:polysaccharide biosynthesis/export family protein [Aliiroseovarius sp. KMU-50]MDA5094648.1 polysaccharide biosynthesis/export family protein [Aliiroseovarius sp. KMU-50]
MLLFCGAFVSGLGALPANAEIYLAAGDRISLKVIGLPELESEILVSTDGTIRLPIIGQVNVEDRSILDLQEEIAAGLSRAPFQIESDTGTQWIQVDATKVFVSVAEYRPIYVTGDVENVGPLAFRPGTSVRQALASAGGMTVLLPDNTASEFGRALSDHMLVSARLEHARGDVKRLKLELSAQEAIAPATSESSNQEALTPDEVEWLTTRSKLRDLEATATDLSLEKMEERLQILGQLEAVNTEVLQTYEDEFARVSELAERGVATANAAAEAERGMLSFSSRVLEISGASHRLKVDMSQLAAKSQVELSETRLEILAQLMNEIDRVQDLEAQLAVLSSRLAYLDPSKALKTQSDSLIYIYRRNSGEIDRMDAGFDTELLPGDVVEFHSVSLPN